MIVKAKPGAKCPREGTPREYITEEPVPVPDTAYYRRMIADGSLIEVPPAPKTKKTGGEK